MAEEDKSGVAVIARVFKRLFGSRCAANPTHRRYLSALCPTCNFFRAAASEEHAGDCGVRESLDVRRRVSPTHRRAAQRSQEPVDDAHLRSR